MIRPAKGMAARPSKARRKAGGKRGGAKTDEPAAESARRTQEAANGQGGKNGKGGHERGSARRVPRERPRDEMWRLFLRTRWRKHRNPLVVAYMPLVRSIAEEIAQRLPRSIDPEDLVSAGTFGLVQSIESFDPGRGTKFETYCRRRIRGAIIDDLRNQDVLSREARVRANRVAAETQRLLQELGREPNLAELAEALEMEPAQVESIVQRATTRKILSLDSVQRDPLHAGDDGVVSDDLVDDEHEPFDLAVKKDLLERIGGSLTEVEREILLRRYGEALTMRDIGRHLGVSESRVCQVHSGLLAKLQRLVAHEE